MKNVEIASVIVCSAFVALALSYAGGSPSPAQFLLMSLLCLFTFGSISVLYREFTSSIGYSDMVAEFMKGLERISYYKESNMPAANSIRKAARSSSNPRISRLFYSIARRMELGDSLHDAIDASTKDDAKLSGLILRYVSGPESSMEEALSLYESVRKESSFKASALNAKYATCNMFLSTVAPSFIMFSFIGSMLISQSSGSTAFMSLALVAAIPVAYSIVSYTSGRRLIG
jgi:hypothetical protein